ncbi:MAG: GatB/YqeY domain-containing protein [Bacteroidales bacterium]
MTLTEKINGEIKEAMKAKERERLEALRGIKKCIIEAQAAKGVGVEVTDDDVLKIIQKLAKQGKDSAKIFEEQNRDDLAQPELAQVAVFEEFLPKQLTSEEIKAKVKNIIASTGTNSMKDMGRVMGQASKEMEGIADGKIIADVVKKLLG